MAHLDKAWVYIGTTRYVFLGSFVRRSGIITAPEKYANGDIRADGIIVHGDVQLQDSSDILDWSDLNFDPSPCTLEPTPEAVERVLGQDLAAYMRSH